MEVYCIWERHNIAEWESSYNEKAYLNKSEAEELLKEIKRERHREYYIITLEIDNQSWANFISNQVKTFDKEELETLVTELVTSLHAWDQSAIAVELEKAWEEK